ncbi:MAG: flagellar hook-basal body complex protein [Alphaproteobacteria bacterium]|nr:flagellar hook-basal body complex protein [Alphaproteobacteria bacterium]
MSLWGTFTNARTAMDAQSQCLGQISTNLANINTTGYKRSDTTFKSILSGNTQTTDNMGVMPVNRRLINDQGLPIETGNGNDLAILGKGFFMVNQSPSGTGAEYFTRDGSFVQQTAITSSGSSKYLTTSEGLYVMGWNADINGSFSSSLEPIRLDGFDEIDGQATTSAQILANIDANPDSTQHLHVPVFDEEFNSHTLNMNWDKISDANDWNLTFDITDGAVTAPAAGQQVIFDQKGTLLTPENGILEIEVSWDDGGTSNIEVDMAKVTQLGGDTNISSVTQNGYPAGKLKKTHFNEDGVLIGTYDNSKILPISKVAIADFVAPENLSPVTGNLYRATNAVGDMNILSIGETNAQSISLSPMTLEGANVEMADEFTKMIVTQKAYSSAATVFKTGDEMFQEATSMKR